MEVPAAQNLPENISKAGLPDIFIGYQKKLMAASAAHSVIFVEKSRRIGATWGMGADAVLTAAANKSAGGQKVFYIGFNLDMTREFIDVCGSWARAFSHAASDVEEFMFKDQDKDGNNKDIQAFRIKFDSGFEIVALTSRPRSLRGRQGYIIIDEAAFHDDLEELMKAALAMLIWGGKVLVISTHNGVDNPFNQYIQDARAGRNNYHVLKIDLDDALKDGLYKRICYVQGLEWSQEAEYAWRQDIVDFYGTGADEELFCVPKRSSGAFLSGMLVEACMEPRPVVRYESDDDFVHKAEYVREQIVNDWCAENLKPLLDELKPDLRSYFGEDFGRSGDLTPLHIIQVEKNLQRNTPFTVELRNVPFSQQRQIIWYILDRLPLLSGAAFDARGNGQQIAEETVQRYGQNIVHAVMTGPAWYGDAFPKYKAALEDRMMILPQDADILADHRVAVLQAGIPRIPDKRTKGEDGGKRHGDALVAAAMAYWASLQEYSEYGYSPASGAARRTSSLRPNEPDPDHGYSRSNTLHSTKGAW